MPYVIDSEHNDNKARLKDIEVPLMRVKIAVETGRELNHTVDGAKEDHGRASVDGPQHRGPSCVRPLFTEASWYDVKAEWDKEKEAKGGDLDAKADLEDSEAGVDSWRGSWSC